MDTQLTLITSTYNKIKKNHLHPQYSKVNKINKNNIYSNKLSVSFTGFNLNKAEKELLGKKSSKLKQKFLKLLEESTKSIKGGYRKLKGRAELPYTEKPLIAANIYDDRADKTKKTLKKLGVSVNDIDRSHNGGMTEIDKKIKISEGIDAIKAQHLPAAEEAEAIRKLKEQISFCSNNVDTHLYEETTNSTVNYLTKNIDKHTIVLENHDNSFKENTINLLKNKSNMVNEIPDHQDLLHSSMESITEKLSGLVDHHDIATGFLENVAEVAEKLGEIPGIDIAAETLVFVKFITPIKDLAKGAFDKAAVKTGTRLIDTVLVPVKLLTAGTGAIKGSILKIKNIEGGGTFRGYNATLKKWNKGRGHIEDKILGIEKDTLEERIAKQEKVINQLTKQAVSIVETAAEKTSSQIESYKNAQIDSIQNLTHSATNVKEIEQQKTAHLETIVNSIQTQLHNEVEQGKARLKDLIIKQKELNDAHKMLAEKIENAQKDNNSILQEQLKKQLQQSQEEYNKRSIEILNNIAKVSYLIKVNEKITSKVNLKGFNRIAGYEKQKNFLVDKFATSISKEKAGEAVNVPAAVMFFGPKGTGKTTFAKAFAEHLNCNLIKVGITLVPEQNLDNLKEAALKAEERFLKDKTRSIILIDEFDSFSRKETSIIPELESFIKNISKDYHCTIFATTNYPERIDSSLFRGSLSHKVSLPVANKENAKAVLKHYAGDFADNALNYDILAQKLVDNYPNAAFSNSRIESLIKGLSTSDKKLGKLLTLSDIEQAITNKGPDISKEDLELFDKQLTYLNNILDDKVQLSEKIEEKQNHISTKVVKSINENEPTRQMYDSSAEKLAKECNLENKKYSIRDVLPDIEEFKGDSIPAKDVLELVTEENKDFIIKQALPSIIRNKEKLDLNYSIGQVLKLLLPETLDCLDKLASNAEKFKINSSTDTLNILKAVTAENKDFAFNELFPYLANNADKYKISRGGYLAKYLEVITPQNKDFMLNTAIPTILDNAVKLNINVSDVAEIAKHVDKDNLKNVQVIADNLDKYDIDDEFGLLDIDKLCSYLNEDKNIT